MRNCIVCNCIIPIERLEALPNTEHCVNCSTVERYKGYMVYPHKTGGECVFISPSNKEAIRIADRANNRSR